MKRKYLWFSLFLTILAGCTSGSVKISDIDMPVTEIRRSIEGIMGEPREVSQNGRTFTSKYFNRNAKSKTNPEQAKERLFAILTVLGDRRPYDVMVEVYSQVKDHGEYSEPDYDDDFSEKVAKEFQTKLNQSRKDINIIDDFRAF